VGWTGPCRCEGSANRGGMRQFRARSVQNRGVFQSKTHSFSFFFQISIDFLKFLIFAFHLLDKKKNVFKFQTQLEGILKFFFIIPGIDLFFFL